MTRKIYICWPPGYHFPLAHEQKRGAMLVIGIHNYNTQYLVYALAVCQWNVSTFKVNAVQVIQAHPTGAEMIYCYPNTTKTSWKVHGNCENTSFYLDIHKGWHGHNFVSLDLYAWQGRNANVWVGWNVNVCDLCIVYVGHTHKHLLCTHWEFALFTEWSSKSSSSIWYNVLNNHRIW